MPFAFALRVYPNRPIAREDLFNEAESRVKFSKKKPGMEASRLCEEAVTDVGEEWLDGPSRYEGGGELLVNGDGEIVNPAFRFGVQQADKLRAELTKPQLRAPQSAVRPGATPFSCAICAASGSKHVP